MNNSGKHKLDAEVIVVGAGPGGASAAYHLARSGHQVLLLDRQKFPRDKSCGDGLTRAAVRLLAEMDVLSRLDDVQEMRGVRMFMRGKGSRDFEYPGGLAAPDTGLVVPRLKLDYAICQQAVAAGAVLWEEALVTALSYVDDVVVGVEVIHQGERKQLRSSVVVVANGAASRLARTTSVTGTRSQEPGYAIRGYYTNITGLSKLLEIYTPLLDVSDRFLLPSYGWVFPTGPTSANIGVGLFQREYDANVRELFQRFLDMLLENDSRFAHAQPIGRWRGAPLRFDFEPEHCVAPGLLLVGDAAGMISPFTGEGISYALESGKLAAEVIHAKINANNSETVDLSDYSRLLKQKYVGYFETGRQSARRYLLVWHVLESTFHNERPLFALCRQAVLFPEGIGESYINRALDDVSTFINHQALSIRADLFTVGEILIDTVRHDWPFLARLTTIEQSVPGIPFRPALLMLLASYLTEMKKPQVLLVGAAIELGYLATLAQISVEEEPGNLLDHPEERQANWGNMFTLMLGDFLLSKAYELSIRAGTQVSHLIADALAQVCEGQVREQRNAYNLTFTEAEYIDMLAYKVVTFFELPCRLGALLSGAALPYVNALAAYGRHLGLAFQLVEDVRILMGKANLMGKDRKNDLKNGIYSLPVIRALHGAGIISPQLQTLLKRIQLTDEHIETVLRLVHESGEINSVLDLARTYTEQAQAALKSLPIGPVRQSLSGLAEYVVTREVTPSASG